jgi:hypothetical protein
VLVAGRMQGVVAIAPLILAQSRIGVIANQTEK